jgi:subtilisin family serine protease
MHRRCYPPAILLSAFVALCASGAPADPPGLRERADAGYGQSFLRKSEVIDRVVRRTGPGTSVRVIIGMEEGFVPMGRLNAWQRIQQRDKIRARQEEMLARLPRGKFVEKRRFANLPFMAVEIDSSQLEQLKSMADVTSVEEDVLDRPLLASSNVVIGSPETWSHGFDGSSQTIAVLDTGVDRSHPFFDMGSKIVAEACFSTNSAGQGGTSACPGGAASSTAAGSGGPCSTADCNHGTHLAGIAAGNDFTGPNFGVARGADIIAIQVFTDFNNSQLCGTSTPCSLSYSSDQIAALDHVYSLRNTYAIAAVNMSLGDGGFTGYCDVSEVARKAAIDNLRSVGIPTIISSGNNGYRDKMQSPACISSAISVAATTDSDTLASFSNVSIATSLVAPGVKITSSTPGGGTATLSGTSMAAPHVAGAWAILKQSDPGATVDKILQELYVTGIAVDDNRGGASVTGLRRINLAAALNPDPPPSVTPVSGSYVPVVGCRLVDTRRSGVPLTPLAETAFMAGKTGQNLNPQGGSSAGCGLPHGVSSIHVNFTAVSEGSSGYLRAWPYGQPEPNATVFAWNGGNSTNALSLPICTAVACPADFVVKLYKDTSEVELVVDLLGYTLE